MKRYYCPNFDLAFLDGEQSHHCLQVMRQKVGALITVFDGRGTEAKARITSVEKDEVRYQILAKAISSRATHPVWLGQALTKRNSMDLILQKATELGVSEIVPLQSDHSVAHVTDNAESKVEKWEKLTVEAAKQCGLNWLPRVQAPRKPKEFLLEVPKQAMRLIASLQPEARSLKEVLRENVPQLKPGTPIVVLIGPEGDFTPAEIGEARAAGFIPVSLGKIILRAETAAFFMLSALAYELMEEK